MAKEYAPGIKRQDYPGDVSKLREGKVYDYVVQQHMAHRAGTHYDFRIGNKPMGMFSWALRYPPVQHEGEKQLAARTNLHTHAYKDFEGVIPFGYGAGKVKKFDEGKVLLTHVTPETISFSIAHKKHPERYTLVKPQDGKNWLLLKQKTPEEPGAEKLHYKTISKDKLDEALSNLSEGSEVQAKIDGALQFLNLRNGKAEMLSHRISKTTGKPVIQTERFFGKVPHLELPKELKDSVLLAEVYGKKKDKAVDLQELGGILNSSIVNALKQQKDKGVNLQAMLFDVAMVKGKDVRSSLPYSERKELLKKFMEVLPKGKFHLPESATTPEEAKALMEKIRTGKHPLTVEGVVVHRESGTPQKHKIMPESDVYIKGFFPAEKGSKYEGKAVGGFTYSLTPDGPVIGRVGTGLNDTTRKMMFDDPDRFVGRTARIHSHGQFGSGAHRVPALIALHEDK